MIFGKLICKFSEIQVSQIKNDNSKKEKNNFAKLISKFNISKFILFIGICLNLSTLIYYKYLSWIVTELANLPGLGNLHVREIALPLGISFFTFHAISYLVDVYKGIVKKHSGVDFVTYFLMFPHLVAGPIVRFESVRPDIQHRTYDRELFCYGVFVLF